MIDDQQDASDIWLSFYPVLQVISLRCNTRRERQYNVKLWNRNQMLRILDDNEYDLEVQIWSDSFPNGMNLTYVFCLLVPTSYLVE